MQNRLDNKNWLLDGLAYRGGLHLILVEARRGEPSDIKVAGKMITGTSPQEVRDDKNGLQLLSRSRCMDHVNKHHGWYKDTVGPAQHDRVWTYTEVTEVIDVIAHVPPTIEECAVDDHPSLY